MSNLYNTEESAEVYAKLINGGGGGGYGAGTNGGSNGTGMVPPLPRVERDDESSSKVSGPYSARDDNNWGALAITGKRSVAWSNSGESESFEEHQKAISMLHKRQAEWDRQMEFHDQKQGELLTLQWKLMREQTGTLARELSIVQQQLQEIRLEGRRMRTEVDDVLREQDGKLVEEKHQRQSVADSLDLKFKKVKQEMDTEMKAKVAPLAEIQKRLTAAEEQLENQARDDRNIEAEVAKLKNLMECCMEDIQTVQASVEREAAERRTQEESTMSMLRELQAAIAKESKDRTLADEELASKQSTRITCEKEEREQALNLLNQRLVSIQKELAPTREELPQIRAKLQEMETLLTSKVKDSQKALERELQERAAAQQKLERRLGELQAITEKEAGLRQQQAEEFEQVLKNHRTKTKALVSEQAEASRQAREDLKSGFAELIEREASFREAQRLDMADQIATNKASAEGRVEALETNLRSLEAKLKEDETSTALAVEASSQRQSDLFSKQLRELGELWQAKLREEKEARESQDAILEEHVGFLDNFLQDVRQVFLQSGSRSRMSLRKPGVPLARPSLDPGSASNLGLNSRQSSQPPSPGGRSNQ